MTRKVKVQAIEAEPTDVTVEKDPVVQLSEMPREQDNQLETTPEEEPYQAQEAQEASQPDEMDTEELQAMFAKTDLKTPKPKKEQPKAECGVCGKTMSAKSLKYKHSKTCKAQEEAEPTMVQQQPPPAPALPPLVETAKKELKTPRKAKALAPPPPTPEPEPPTPEPEQPAKPKAKPRLVKQRLAASPVQPLVDTEVDRPSARQRYIEALEQDRLHKHTLKKERIQTLLVEAF